MTVDKERIARLLADRMDREPKAVSAAPEPVADTVDDFSAMFGRLAERTRLFKAEWLERVKDERAELRCSIHAAVVIAPDPEASMVESHRTLRGGRWDLRWVFPRCPECVREEGQAKERAHLVRAGVPELLLDASFDNWTPQTPGDVAALKTCRAFAANPVGFLLILSPAFGNGKTHLAVAIMRALRRGVFKTQRGFLEDLRASYGSKRPDPRAAMKAKRFAVMDEMGLSVGGADELPALHDVMDHYHDHRIPMVLTGNFPGIEPLRPILGPRVFDRFKQSIFSCLVLNSPSARIEQRAAYLKSVADVRPEW